MGRQQREVNILLVEDNPDHAELSLKALKDGNLLNEIFWVKDGEEALDFLYRRGRYADATTAPIEPASRPAQLESAYAHQREIAVLIRNRQWDRLGFVVRPSRSS